MSTRIFTAPLAVIVSIIASSSSLLLLPATTAHAAGNDILVTFDATKQGKLKGEGNSGKIAITAFSREIKSPRDAATGQVSGRSQNLPVVITKSVDAASPQLFQAMTTNEVLKSVIIEFYGTTPAGERAVTQTIKLTNATVAGLRQYTDSGDGDAPAAAADAALREDVSLSYQTLELVSEGGAAVAEAPVKPTKSLDPAAPAAGPAPSPGASAGAAPSLTRTPRLAPIPGATAAPGTISPKMTPTDAPAPRLAPAAAAPAPSPTATATEAPAVTTAPTLTRAQRARRAAAAAAAATAPTTAPTVEAKSNPATQPATAPVAPLPPRRRR